MNIDNIENEELRIFTTLNEHQLSHIYEPKVGVFIAESLKVLERALAAGYEPLCALIEDTMAGEVHRLLDAFPKVMIYEASFDCLKELVGYHLTGGVLCAMRRKVLPSVSDIINGANNIAILENVVNPTNVGAIIRNAAALGIDGILLSPGSCDPLYKRSIRVSMGTVFQIPWTFVPKEEWQDDCMKLLKKNNFATVAMALDDNSVSIDDKKLRSEGKKAVLLGSEGYGLDINTLNLCDYTVMIPMSHGVDSLNVAAASALAFWELGRN